MREGEFKWGRGRKRQRQRQRENIPSRFHAVGTKPDVGLKLTNLEIVTLAKIKSLLLN